MKSSRTFTLTVQAPSGAPGWFTSPSFQEKQWVAVAGGSGEWNSSLPIGYMNNAPSLQAFYQRFTQIIFSKQSIPCPQV